MPLSFCIFGLILRNKAWLTHPEVERFAVWKMMGKEDDPASIGWNGNFSGANSLLNFGRVRAALILFGFRNLLKNHTFGSTPGPLADSGYKQSIHFIKGPILTIYNLYNLHFSLSQDGEVTKKHTAKYVGQFIFNFWWQREIRRENHLLDV